MILLSFLNAFGSVSGYKLNISKSQILSFNYRPSQIISSKFKLNWDMDHIKYLGVNIPRELTNLYELNFNSLSQKIKEDIRRWNLISVLGFESQIESVKINILPRVLFLFQTVPVEITDEQFNEWDELEVDRLIGLAD